MASPAAEHPTRRATRAVPQPQRSGPLGFAGAGRLRGRAGGPREPGRQVTRADRRDRLRSGRGSAAVEGGRVRRSPREAGVAEPALDPHHRKLLPRPETNPLICHGRVAARAGWRARVVAYGRAAPKPTAMAPALVAGAEGTKAKSDSRAWSWAALMRRAFALDVLEWPTLWGPAAADRHTARSRGDPDTPRAPGDGPLRAEPRSRPTRIQRHRVLIDSGPGGRRRARAASSVRTRPGPRTGCLLWTHTEPYAVPPRGGAQPRRRARRRIPHPGCPTRAVSSLATPVVSACSPPRGKVPGPPAPTRGTLAGPAGDAQSCAADASSCSRTDRGSPTGRRGRGAATGIQRRACIPCVLIGAVSSLGRTRSCSRRWPRG
jgi:hypothetical protein